LDINLVIKDSFKQSDLLSGITEEHYTDIFGAGNRKILKSKSILFHQGDPAKLCYFLLGGHVKLAKVHELGKEAIIRYIGPGELIAVAAVLKEKEYPVSAETKNETEIVTWDKQTMLNLMRKYPDLAINMLCIVIEHMDEVQRRYLELSTEHVELRIARSLLRIMRHAKYKSKDEIRIDFPISRQDLADYTGTTLYTVSRTLSAWERRGWIKSRREQITITDVQAIVLFAEHE